MKKILRSKLIFRPTQPFSKKIQIFVDDVPYEVSPHLTIFQACSQNGIIIPRFCYHEKLSIAGNCRMCLVEVEKAPKPIASCAAQVLPNMRIKTRTEMVKIARGGVMEFLLANHPLDCPICDQGGECDLQDQSFTYGYEQGRFLEQKRAVEDKNVGPLIATIMNRCIHCTRCVRFAEEVGGIFTLGTTGRGQETEIGTYVEKMVTSELSGNLVDLCPVGALTNAPYSFTTRPWELSRTSSIDLMEGICPSVEYDYRGVEIMRTLPRVHEQVNDEWIGDKSRYSYDGLKRQRLAFPLVKNRMTGEFEEIKWETAINLLKEKLQDQGKFLGVVGEFVSLENLTAFKDFMNRLDSNEFAYSSYPIKGYQREDYLLNRTIQELETIDNLVLVGFNPKLESPVLNARILKSVKNGLKVFKVGPAEDLNYDYEHLGTTVQSLEALFQDPKFKAIFRNGKNNHIIVSGNLVNELPSFNQLFLNLKSFVHSANTENPENLATVGVFHNFSGYINAYELGLKFKGIKEIGEKNVVLNLGNDNKKFLQSLYSKPQDFTVYIGTHGDEGAAYADLILPGAAWTEQTGSFLNIEGRSQLSKKIVPPPVLAKEQWEILRVLSEELGTVLNYNNQEELRYRMAELSPSVLKYDFVESYSLYERGQEQKKLKNQVIPSTVDNYYKTDSISNASLVMSKCSSAFNRDKMLNIYIDPTFKQLLKIIIFFQEEDSPERVVCGAVFAAGKQACSGNYLSPRFLFAKPIYAHVVGPLAAFISKEFPAKLPSKAFLSSSCFSLSDFGQQINFLASEEPKDDSDLWRISAGCLDLLVLLKQNSQNGGNFNPKTWIRAAFKLHAVSRKQVRQFNHIWAKRRVELQHAAQNFLHERIARKLQLKLCHIMRQSRLVKKFLTSRKDIIYMLIERNREKSKSQDENLRFEIIDQIYHLRVLLNNCRVEFWRKVKPILCQKPVDHALRETRVVLEFVHQVELVLYFVVENHPGTQIPMHAVDALQVRTCSNDVVEKQSDFLSGNGVTISIPLEHPVLHGLSCVLEKSPEVVALRFPILPSVGRVVDVVGDVGVGDFLTST